jgi:hypothetical protein
MATEKNDKPEETSILVYNSDRLRLKELAADERRLMKDMFTILLDAWDEKKNG